MSKEYLKDPHGQFYKHLDKLLDIGHQQQGIPSKDIIQHVQHHFLSK